MASVATTTIRVRRTTHQRLQKQAEATGQSVTQVLEEAADLLEEQRMLESFARSYEKHGDEIRAEMRDWEATASDGLQDEDWSGQSPPDVE